MSDVLAHLDRKTGQRILCGRCGNEIARIREDADGRYVAFPPGWVVNAADGAWTLSRHARAGVKRGRPPAFRGKPQPTTGLPRGGRPLEDADYTNWNRPGRVSGTLLDRLPAQAVCPTCGAKPWLTTEKLGVQPFVPATASVSAQTVDGTWVDVSPARQFDSEPGTVYTDL